jgi:DNA-binding NtrC family response regulator
MIGASTAPTLEPESRHTEPPSGSAPAGIALPLGPASRRLPEAREASATLHQLIEHLPIPRLKITIERENGVAATKVITFDGDECRIGTHPSNDVVLSDRSVSRFHCRIVRDSLTWRILDSGSRNGTKLDGVKIRDAELAQVAPAGTSQVPRPGVASGIGGLLQIGSSVLRLAGAESDREVDIPVTPAFGQLAGASVAMRKLFAMLERVAASEINVLITGESGTGKELVASEIVRQGPRSNKPFVVVDCGAISPQLIESELFGHVRGAFTGADRERLGAFESANGGTVFLDEIGELPLELQPKLLRALEAREIRRVGESKARKIDVRVVSATNRELDREVNKGRFREDLYFRLAVISVKVPSLRERLEDLILLIRVFLNQLGVPEEERLFTGSVQAEMSKHDWPGNVRELRNYVERAVVLKGAFPDLRDEGFAVPSSSPNPSRETLGAKNVDPSAPRLPFRIAKEHAVDAFEKHYLHALLDESQGNLSKASRLASMDRMYLHKLVQKHGMKGGSLVPPAAED